MNKQEVHKIIGEAIDKTGIIDGFYVGINAMGQSVTGYSIGDVNRADPSYIERLHHLIGAVETSKQLLVIDFLQAQRERMSSNGDINPIDF